MIYIHAMGTLRHDFKQKTLTGLVRCAFCLSCAVMTLKPGQQAEEGLAL